MEERMIFAGFGGQGVLFSGKLLAIAGMLAGKHVTWFPSYGPEMRGGTANCSVVISDKKIGSPVVDKASLAVVMNISSLEKFEPMVKPGGVLVVNSSIVKKEKYRDDIKVVEIPANSIAEECGSAKVANMVIIGAVLKCTDLLPLDIVIEALKEEIGEKRPELLPLNIKAIEKGMEYVK